MDFGIPLPDPARLAAIAVSVIVQAVVFNVGPTRTSTWVAPIDVGS
jgi:hypothetical protein